ncbi:MAG: rRNA maturation RNase YbeY [Acidimicrobiia bacterium]|nr:rRNA maturation RNase YbeY [Acidimicrobiia bacterium]
MTVTFIDDRNIAAASDQFVSDELIALAEATLSAEGLDAGTEVAITLIDAVPMAELNQSHMGKAGPTDVLSFPLENLAPGTVPQPISAGPPVSLGDVFICPEVVGDNAAAARVPLRDEMALMVVHGLLHLLGYDHVVDSEAEQMEQRERDLMASIGLVRP